MSVELSLEDVKSVAVHYGFQFEVKFVLYILFARVIFHVSECINLTLFVGFFFFFFLFSTEGKYHRDDLHNKFEINDASKLHFSPPFIIIKFTCQWKDLYT